MTDSYRKSFGTLSHFLLAQSQCQWLCKVISVLRSCLYQSHSIESRNPRCRWFQSQGCQGYIPLWLVNESENFWCLIQFILHLRWSCVFISNSKQISYWPDLLPCLEYATCSAIYWLRINIVTFLMKPFYFFQSLCAQIKPYIFFAR